MRLIFDDQGQDTLDGGDGDDTIYGHGGGDTLTGGSGDDLIIAGDGSDTVTGGIGADGLHGGFTVEYQTELINPDITASDEFGRTISISDNYIAVAAPYDDASATDAGAVYVYDLEGVLQYTLNSPVADNDQFGFDLEMSDQYLLIGADYYDNVGSL